MKAEELSIGDWVNVPNYYWDDSPYVGKVDGIVKKHGTYYLQFSDAFSAEIDKCEPIPITQEILEKNGFVLESEGWVYYKNPKLKEQDYICISFRHNGETRSVEINFMHKAQCVFRHIYDVHELQHAFRLCGITKEIEL